MDVKDKSKGLHGKLLWNLKHTSYDAHGKLGTLKLKGREKYK